MKQRLILIIIPFSKTKGLYVNIVAFLYFNDSSWDQFVFYRFLKDTVDGF
jgi:hypothetical protein